MENYINSLFSINHALQNGFKSILDKYKVSNSSLWGYSHFFPPIAPFKNRLAPQGSTPLAAARGLAALHPIPETFIHKPKPGSCRKDGSCPVL
ncbi:MAG: hypothetical protein U0N32_08820, partial [Oscillospiraceae bacterium]